jgi:hypothetical protein
LEKACSANPEHALPHAYLASAHALKGAGERAAAELEQARKLCADDRYSSIARLKAVGPFGTPKISALFEATFLIGLARRDCQIEKTMSPRRDRKSETTTCEKWPQKRLGSNACYFCHISKKNRLDTLSEQGALSECEKNSRRGRGDSDACHRASEDAWWKPFPSSPQGISTGFSEK